MKTTIEDLESRLEKDFSAVIQSIITNIPKGFRHRVALHGKKRKARKDASAENWSPESGEIRIYFEPDPRSIESTSNTGLIPSVPVTKGRRGPEGKSMLRSDPLSDLVRALDRAESKPGYDFVALKWFRDAFLSTEGLEWASVDSTRNSVLRDAIEKRLVLTFKVANPKNSEYPVTAIRLNRMLPETRAILGSPEPAELEFRPVKIRGEGLSTTILRERR